MSVKAERIFSFSLCFFLLPLFPRHHPCPLEVTLTLLMKTSAHTGRCWASLCVCIPAVGQPELVRFPDTRVMLPLDFFINWNSWPPGHKRCIPSLACDVVVAVFQLLLDLYQPSHRDGNPQLRSESSHPLSASLLLPSPKGCLFWPFRSFQPLGFIP